MEVLEVLEQWSSWETVDREFGEALSELYDVDTVYITELQARRMIHVLRKWLTRKGHRDGLKLD